MLKYKHTKAGNDYPSVIEKNMAIVEEICSKWYQPEDRTLLPSTMKAMVKHRTFMTENAVEHSFVAAGNGYTLQSDLHYDFSDYSEAKTAMVNLSGQARITGVKGKIGPIRAVLWNRPAQRLDYFFLPPIPFLEHGKLRDNRRNGLELFFRWIRKTDSYGQFEQYRVSSFEELAKLKYKGPLVDVDSLEKAHYDLEEEYTFA